MRELSTASLLEALGAVVLPPRPGAHWFSEAKLFRDRITPRVRSFDVRGLFGIYDHRISLSPSPGLTIIHGPNGIGKTRFMELLDFVTARWSFDHERPWHMCIDGLKIALDDGSSLVFRRMDAEGAHGQDLHYGEIAICRGESQILLRKLIEAAEALPFPDRLGGKYLPDWLRPLVVDDRCTLIPSDRLFEVSQERSVPAVDVINSQVEDMAHHIARTHLGALDSLIAALREELERSGAENWNDVAQRGEEQEDRFRSAMEREADAVAAGVLDDEVGVLRREWDRSRDLALVFASLPRFAEVEAGLVQAARGVAAATAFVSIMREMMSDKVFRIDKAGVHCSMADSNGPDEIPLADLSSGEQHLVVLFGKLLFDAVPGSLVMIDEPELSMHVAWQDCLVEKFIEAGKLADVDILLATHSPHIIGDHWDLAVELKGPGE